MNWVRRSIHVAHNSRLSSSITTKPRCVTNNIAINSSMALGKVFGSTYSLCRENRSFVVQISNLATARFFLSSSYKMWNIIQTAHADVQYALSFNNAPFLDQQGETHMGLI